jgi:hypothetical protein
MTRKMILLALPALVLGAALAWAGIDSAPLTVTVTPTAQSPDGTVITPTAKLAPGSEQGRAASAAPGQIVTAEGVWTFGAPPRASGDYPLLLNGSNANGGYAVLLEVLNGHLYAQDKGEGHYWLRWNGAWRDVGTTAPAEGTVATGISFAGIAAQLPDNSPAGTVVANATVTMSPASAPFTELLVSSNPLYAFQGTNIVTARALTAADDGAQPATITAVQ